MQKPNSRRKPIVFISSTAEDLKEFRQRVQKAALSLGFHPRGMEDFPANGKRPLEACLELVSGSDSEAPSDLLVVVSAYRYGWVPEDQAPDEHKSITWLECLQAEESGLEILAFLVDKSAPWDESLKEQHRVTKALDDGIATPELLQEVQRNVKNLKAFHGWLSDGRIRGTFANPDQLRAEVTAALHDWLKRHPEFEVEAEGDPSHYLRSLRSQTAYIDIRGLQVGSGKASRFPIEELYIALKTAPLQNRDALGVLSPDRSERPEPIELETALSHRRLVVTGDPGGGKTTFLRRICQLACRSMLDQDAQAIERLGFEEPPFPILLRLSDLQDHRKSCKGRRGAPTVWSSPEWLPHFLASEWAKEKVALQAGFFRKKLQNGPALVLLDGLDEAPNEEERQSLVHWIEEASTRWESCRIVVISRPAAYRGESTLPGFAHASIEDLDDSAIETFFTRWCQALYPVQPDDAERHQAQLTGAIRSRPEIRRLARNPVMLTALAVVHWNETRLPEQRAELYDSILAWLSRSRPSKPGRIKPERCILILQNLALSMHCHPQGRRTQVTRYEAAQSIAGDWRELPQEERLATAEGFLRREEEDSGIIVGRGHEVRFWHLTFQEHLTARALAARPDRWPGILFESGQIYQPEWREVISLLGGVLQIQGMERVDSLFSALLDDAAQRDFLQEKACAAGLLGSILRDLSFVPYRAPDPSKYQRLLDECMAVFDRERSKEVSIETAIEAAEAIGQAGDPRFDEDRLEQNWVEMPAGEFWMGAQDQDEADRNFDAQAWKDERPPHRVYLDAYRIGRYPVTVGEYRRFIEAGGYQEEEHWREGGFGHWKEPWLWEHQSHYPNRPVMGVSWLEAAAYAHWRGAELATEAQWERAARGAEGVKSSWGDREPGADLFNFGRNVGHPTSVGIYPRESNQAGICDLSGNVWEWCRSWYGPYDGKSKRNPLGPGSGDRRVLRGGSWSYDAGSCRASNRGRYRPFNRGNDVGFRLVLADRSAKT